MPVENKKPDKAAVNKLAGELYETFNKALGGLDPGGQPFPTWEQYSNNEFLKVRVEAWLAVAESVIKR